MNNVIKNPKIEVSTGISLNEKDYMNSLLSILKECAKNYTVALTEASNEHLYKELKSEFDKIIKLQREVFETMFRYGWYTLEKAGKSKVSNKYDTLNKELKDMLK